MGEDGGGAEAVVCPRDSARLSCQELPADGVHEGLEVDLSVYTFLVSNRSDENAGQGVYVVADVREITTAGAVDDVKSRPEHVLLLELILKNHTPRFGRRRVLVGLCAAAAKKENDLQATRRMHWPQALKRKLSSRKPTSSSRPVLFA